MSTQEQRSSGLNLKAGQAAGRLFVTKPAQLGEEFIDSESGKRDQLAQLAAAIAEPRRTGATLLIAKLARPSRNAGFIFALRDLPDATTLTVGLFAVIAQHERETISKRTKEALAAKKAWGAQLGTPANFTPVVQALGRTAMQRNAREHQDKAARLAGLLRAQEHTLQQVADELNQAGYRTRRGNIFRPTTVQRLLPAPGQSHAA